MRVKQFEINNTFDASGVTNITGITELVSSASTHYELATAKAVYDIEGELTGNYYLTAVSGSGNTNPVTFTMEGTTDVEWDPTHNHDERYYTETETDANFLSGDTSLDDLTTTITDTQVAYSDGTNLVGSADLTFNTNELKVNGTIYSEGTNGSLPITGSGTRFMWIPNKAAFRIGLVTADQWDILNVGYRSFAGGYNCISQGNNSFSFGTTNTATGTDSFAIGNRAGSNHSGTFTWSDRTGTDFNSTDQSQFLIRASNGVGINTNSPTSSLTISGDTTFNGNIIFDSQTISGITTDLSVSATINELATADAIKAYVGGTTGTTITDTQVAYSDGNNLIGSTGLTYNVSGLSIGGELNVYDNINLINGTDSFIKVGEITGSAVSQGGIVCSNYYTTNDPVMAFFSYNTTAENNTYFGGGLGSYNSATKLQFWTSDAGINDSAGSKRMLITKDGIEMYVGLDVEGYLTITGDTTLHGNIIFDGETITGLTDVEDTLISELNVQHLIVDTISATTIHGATLVNLTDTTITSPTEGQTLYYSGGTWINKTCSCLSTSGDTIILSGDTVVDGGFSADSISFNDGDLITDIVDVLDSGSTANELATASAITNYVDANSYWDRSGSIISPVTSTDNLAIGGNITGGTENQSYLSTDQMALSQLHGGAYFGRVGITENQLYLSNIGDTWTAKDSSRTWDSVAMSSDGKIQTAVATGYIYISNDYGYTWTAKDSSRYWRGIAMSSDGKIQTAVEYHGEIFVSNDYGYTWTQKATSEEWSGIAMSSDGKIQTAVEYHGYIYISNDYGYTWTAKDSSRTWDSVAMSSDGKIQTAVDNGYIYISNDYGYTWTAKATSEDWRDIAMSSDGKIQTAVATGYIYISNDYGYTWTAKDSSRSWRGIAMSSDGKIQTAIVYGGQLYVSHADSNINGNTNVSTLTTSDPSSGSATWKLGDVITSGVTLVTTDFVEVEIGGTLYKIALVE